MTSNADRAEIYRTQDGQWWWRIKAANNEIIAQGESYNHRHDLESMLAEHFPDIPIVNLEEKP